ncbi:hypothetical protein DZD18_06930 [Rhodobacteraceae bacterium W635]|uniref:hypothetical protein n=1 Tax=Nioella halotolerans TaxID=2303578 RepID=UPI000E3C7EA3|nr:hypothetical protein DZD18_06930 [Rhodobacteraceae bacterium W635]
MTDPDEVLQRITPSLPRRVMATGGLAALGLLLLWVTANQPPADMGFLVFNLVIGAGSLWLSVALWRATGVTLELTRETLRERDGRVLTSIDNIARVDRGFFAFKPAAGFRLSLKVPMPGAYAPGLWWRRRRMVMVGGVTARPQTKAVADLISIRLAQKRGEL